MSELHKAFIYVIFLSAAAFWIAARALPQLLTVAEFKRWRNLWLIVVASAFLAHNMWIFVGAFILITIFFIPRVPKNAVIYYLLLLCALPILMKDIPAIGIRFLFQLTYPRLLTLTLLFLPYFTRRPPIPLFANKTDKWMMMYLILISFAAFRGDSFSNAFRTIFLYFLDIFLPYFMLSRYLADQNQLNRGLIAFLIGIAPTACVAIFETLKHWHLYIPLTRVLTGKDPSFTYDVRAGGLRASSIFKGPIILGYTMVIGIGIYMYFKPLMSNPKVTKLVGLALLGGLLAPMARGPWIACLAAVIAFIWTGPNPFKQLTAMGFLGVISLPILAMTEKGAKLLELIPFLGTIRADTIDYRERLLDVGIKVFKKHPWLGSTNFREDRDMQELVQGQGIIDLVNSYLQIGLSYGAIGVVLFLCIFGGMLIRCYFIIKKIPPQEADLIRLGRACIAMLIGIMLTIFTTSSIDYVDVLYWTFSGIFAAYLYVAEKTIKEYRFARQAAGPA